MDLIIVESPSKAKTIAKYLGGKYRVDASGGHIRDLPEKTIGIAVDKNFEPRYVISSGKEETVKRLADEAKRAGKVYLATVLWDIICPLFSISNWGADSLREECSR